MTIHTKNEYFRKVTNVNNPLMDKENKPLERAQVLIEDELVSGNKLISDLQKLKNEDKVKFIVALIQNDKEMIVSYLNPLLKKMSVSIKPEILEQIAEITDYNDSGEWINSVVSSLIQGILSKCRDIEQARLLQMAMQRIPDSELTTAVKKAIITEVNPTAIAVIESYAYVAPLAAMQKNKYLGDISKNEYFAIYKYEYLDLSEYIICTIGLLQDLVRTPMEKDLVEQLRLAYDEVRYGAALKLIEYILGESTFIGEGGEYKAACDAIIQRGQTCYLPNIAENHSRRFYENRIIQLGTKSVDLTKVNKVALSVSNTAISSTDELGSVPNAALMSQTNKPEFKVIYNKLIQSSERMRKRIRTRKEGVLPSKEDSSLENKEKLNVEIWSSNLGVMTSNQPNFRDEISDISMRNRIVDKDIMRGRGEADDPSHFVAYVASISGHAFWVVPLLEEYMELNQADPSLSKDINNYLKAIIIGYVKNGYHSEYEIVEIFQVPEVIKIFDRYGVTLDFDWHADVIRQAMLDTQEYTKVVCLNKAALQEIESLRKSEDKQVALENERVVYTHLEDQFDMVRKALTSNNDPSFFSTTSVYPNPMSLRILSELRRLEQDSKHERADLKTISGDISILIHDVSEKIARTLKSGKNDDKFYKMLEKLAVEVDAKYDLIEKIYSKDSAALSLKPSQIKRNNFRK